MSTEIKVPLLGESVPEATVTQWFKEVGESVRIDEPLVELETDKITVEVPAPITGILEECVVPVGHTVAVGEILGRIAERSEGVGPKAPPPVTPPSTIETSVAEKLSPSVRRLVAEQTMNPSMIPATGKGGRLTKEDVINFQSAATHAHSPSSPQQQQVRHESYEVVRPDITKRVRMSRLRQRIAARLKEAQNSAAMLTTFNEVDMTELIELRKKHREAFEKKYKTRLGFMAIFTKACVAALKTFPAVNAEIDGEDIIYKEHYNIGIAVSTAQGLVVPVVHDADLKCFSSIEIEISDLVRRARDGLLKVEDLSNGTFTITNGGIYGSLMSTPILNAPQSGILGMHRIHLRPVVMSNSSIEARQMMYLALSYDHRIIDGREAVSFLVRIKECIEDPIRLFLDV